jgi:hypothetical protein
VCTRHGQHVPALQQMLSQPLRAAGIGRAGIEDGLHERELGRAVGQMRTRDDIADHEHVGRQGHLLGAKALDQIDAQLAQLVTHGRVDARVAARNAMAGTARQGGQTAHEGAADAEDMDVHGAGF